MTMQRTDFHFELPKELIAQKPAAERSASRLLALDGATGAHQDLLFSDFPSLVERGDLLVFNDTRVIPARVFGNKPSGGKVEILLERVLSATTALTHVRASKGLKIGAEVALAGGHSARMLCRDEELFLLEFSCEVLGFFESYGEMPLPPYIDRIAEQGDRERYQTVYARTLGAVAAPTAGLHFDAAIFRALAARGIQHAFVTLHVGAGTFAPMRSMDVDAHRMHREYLDVPSETCAAIEATRSAGHSIIAVGTTVVRSLETAASGGSLRPFQGMTDIFIKPGFQFRAIDAMLTNFHLPESTLLMLCSAFVGREALLQAYAHAVESQYRFFSYGDAMFLKPARGALPRS